MDLLALVLSNKNFFHCFPACSSHTKSVTYGAGTLLLNLQHGRRQIRTQAHLRLSHLKEKNEKGEGEWKDMSYPNPFPSSNATSHVSHPHLPFKVKVNRGQE